MRLRWFRPTIACVLAAFALTTGHSLGDGDSVQNDATTAQIVQHQIRQRQADNQFQSTLDFGIGPRFVTIDAVEEDNQPIFADCTDGQRFVEGIGCVDLPKCVAGYTLDAALASCIDINECATAAGQNISKCTTNAQCLNTIGSFRCRCRPGFAAVAGRCIQRTTCPQGYNYSTEARQCQDINECAVPLAGQRRCSRFGLCANTLGSFTCSCRRGYTGDGKTCLRIRVTSSSPPSQTATGATVGSSAAIASVPTTFGAPKASQSAASRAPSTAASAPGVAPTTTKPSIVPTVTPSSSKPAATTTAAVPSPSSPSPNTTNNGNFVIIDSFDDLDPCFNLIDKTTNLSIRREWRELTQLQRQTYIDAIRELVAAGTYRTVIPFHEPDFIEMAGHQTNAFLHWHRHFLMMYEQQLRSLGPKYRCVTIPYWDWTLDIKDDICETPKITVIEELGGTGNACVDRFGDNLRYPVRGASKPLCITRPFGHRMGWRPPGPIEVSRGIIDRPEFSSFQSLLKAWHGLVHNRIGGTMADIAFSPNDPIFFLHHGFIDKVFATWQECHNRVKDPGPFAPPSLYLPNYAIPYPHEFDDPLANFPTRVTPRMVNDITKLGYTYSGDRMESEKSWSPLGGCRNMPPWVKQIRQTARRSASDSAEKDQTREFLAEISKALSSSGMARRQSGNYPCSDRQNVVRRQAPTNQTIGIAINQTTPNQTTTTAGIPSNSTDSIDKAPSMTWVRFIKEYPELAKADEVQDEKNLRQHLSKKCQEFLAKAYAPGKTFVEIVRDAAKLECSVFTPYGPLDDETKKYLNLADFVMPCESLPSP